MKALPLVLALGWAQAASGMASAAESTRNRYEALAKGAQPHAVAPMWPAPPAGSVPSYMMMPQPFPLQNAPLDMRQKAVSHQKLRQLSRQMSSLAMKLNTEASSRIRYLASNVYRQIKLNVDTPFYKKVARNVQTLVSRRKSRVRLAGAENGMESADVTSCYALLTSVRDFLDDRDRRLLDEYLEFVQPGMPEADREFLGCWSETVPNAGFQRFFFKLADKDIENLVVRALERAGNVEVVGTRAAGKSEALGQAYLQSMKGPETQIHDTDEPWV